MKSRLLWICFLGVALLAPGCMTGPPQGLDPLDAPPIEKASWLRNLALSRETEEKILSLDPADVKEKEIREVLSQAPAPRIINIHGGVLPVKSSMVSFSRFLIGMGYPEISIRNPGNGSYTFGYYDSSEKIAGAVAWYYEKEGLRPMIVGHSQGGILTVRVLHKLAGDSAKRLSVWNPLTGKEEDRNDISDPLTGTTRPVVGLQVSYATAVGAGGLARVLPHQWNMNTRLRKIPDSVEEFTGFHKGLDPLGGDFLGYGPANNYKPTGKALVRNVRLPSAYWHSTIPNTQHLVRSQQIKDWINNYRPTGQPIDTPSLDVQFDSDTSNILWAADVWYSIKKHWVLELQRVIRAKRALHQGA
jgi:pimeloyl-ACP methyl ester carboxylesterase